MASLTPSVSTSSPPQSPSTKPVVVQTSLSDSKRAGIIAGAVVVGVLLVCIAVAIIVPLQRKRGRSKIQRQAYGAKSEVAASASASDGMSPLLVTPHVWQSRQNDVEDDAGAADHGPDITEHSIRSRGTSDSTLLMPFVHESDQRASYPSNTYTNPQTRDYLRPVSPKISPLQRMLTVDSVMSHESTYSQASASTRIHRDLGERYTSSPPPVPSLPAQLQLPPIPKTEPIGELLKARAAAAGTSSWSANESSESASFSPTSIYSPAAPSTSSNFTHFRQLSRGSSNRARSPNQPLQNTPNRLPRGTLGRARTILPNAPMEPLMEFDGSSLWSLSANGNGKERWSSAADPGGSHPRSTVLDKEPNKEVDTSRQPQPPPLTPPYLTPSHGLGIGRGLSLLTTAFRKSLSASSDATHGSGSSLASQPTGNMNALHHYPSVASMGASVTSGTGSGTGSFYTAMSDPGNDPSSAGNRNSGMGLLPPSIMKKKKGSQASLSTYPSIPSLPSTTRPSRPNPPVPAVPQLPPKVTSPPPRTLDAISNLSSGPSPKSNSTPRAKAHLRTPAAHRVRADPHPQPAITRAGRSTHGLIDGTED